VTRLCFIDTARELSQQGLSQRKIAARLKVSQATVGRWLKDGYRKPVFAEVVAEETFGRLIAQANSNGAASSVLCTCECGNSLSVRASNLRSGNTQSCGCSKVGQSNGRYRHGKAGTKIYNIWADMIGRCTRLAHARYADYGGRGITVCERWHDFAAFYEDMGDRPRDRSLDRRNNDGGYWCGHCAECASLGRPANCRWATGIQQRANRRPQRPRKPANTEVNAV